MKYLLVLFGGGIGSVARYTMMNAVSHRTGTAFPWYTLSVNLLGAFIIGAVTELLALRFNASEPMRLLLVTGFLGGFTTFSAFSLEGALMWQKGDFAQLAVYAAVSVAGTILAVFGGIHAVRAVL